MNKRLPLSSNPSTTYAVRELMNPDFYIPEFECSYVSHTFEYDV